MKNYSSVCRTALGVSILTTCLLLSAPAAYSVTNGNRKTFAEWCLDKHAPNRTKELINQILKHSDTFNCNHAEQQLKHLQELQVNGVFDDLSPLASLPNLKKLEIYNRNESGTDLGPLSEMKQLTHLKVGRTVQNIAPLADLVNLIYLDLSGNIVRDIRPIERLTRLSHLELSGDFTATGLAPLSALTDLTFLRINGRTGDISSLHNLTRLEVLHMHQSNVEDVSPLADLINLRVLRLTRSPIRDICPLSSLQNLVELDLRETKVEDRTPLSKLPNLKVLLIDESLGLR